MQRLSSSSPNLAQSTRDALMDLLNEPALRERLAQACPAAYCDGELKLDLLMEEIGKYADLGDEERYEFRWNGKQRAKQLAQTPSTCTLRPCPEESKNWDTTQNLYIEGDNLEVLKILQRAYSGKIKMIYIDPPYNTDHDFIYKDDFSDSLANYLKQTGALDDAGKLKSSNTAADGRYHTNWLNMMYPRLRLAKNLLTEDGVIFISIDDNEQANLKKMCDEVFGAENLLSIFIWNKQHSQQQGIFKKYHESVLCYSKNIKKQNNISGGIGVIDAGAQKKVSRANPASPFKFPAGVRFDAPDGTCITGTFGNSEKTVVLEGRLIAKNGKTAEPVTLSAGWTQKNQMTEFFNGNPVFDTKGQKVVEFYFSSTGKIKCIKEREKITPPSILPLYGMVSEQSEALANLFDGYTVFDSPKPVAMIQDFASWFTKENDIIIDFFSGSGTTAHSIFKLNSDDNIKRKFILIQLPEIINPIFDKKGNIASEDTNNQAIAFLDSMHRPHNICEIGKERIRRAGEKVVSDQLSAVSSGKPSASSGQRSVFGDQPTDNCPLTTDNLDIGFKVFKLADSNMNKWKLELADLSNKSEMEKAAIEGIMAATNTIRRKEIEAENEQRREAGLAPFDIDLCVVYEWLLKYGVQLDKRVEVVTVAGKRVYMVSGGAFMICLDDGLDQNWAQALVAERDMRIGSLGATTVSDMWHVMVADASFTANNLLNVEHYLTANGLKGEHFIVV